MLTEEQLLQTQEMLAAAVSYNLAMHAAFISEDDMVEVDLKYNGQIERVSVPTYHYLLKTVDKLSKQVAQMQISDDGSDVIQLLSTADNLTLLYLQKRQYYVQAPMNAKIVKYDYETCPTMFSSADKTAIHIDLSDCKLPMDAMYIIAHFDEEPVMRLPILFKTTCFDKLGNVLLVNDSGGVLTYTVDSNDFEENMLVQCNSNLYKITSIAGQTLQLESLQPTVIKPIEPGDIIYSVTDNATAFVEVPVCKVHKQLHLQVQYMQLLSNVATYDVSGMGNEVHASLLLPLKQVLKGRSLRDDLDVLNLSLRDLPADIEQIIANSTPIIDKANIGQTNLHQYTNSVLEQMMEANALLVQAKSDIDRLQGYINEFQTNEQVQGDRGVQNQELTEATLTEYVEQLASAKNRYYAAQQQLAGYEVSAQQVAPHYNVTLHVKPKDSKGAKIIQFVARYQYTSLNVQEYSTNWQYVYSDKRYINQHGELYHPIDDYSIMDKVNIPIRAYEQLVVQVSAILQYGQPLITCQTGWTEPLFLTVPATLLKEVSLEQMFKNAYEAKLYTSIQQAMEAAGVFNHIDPRSIWKHKAEDILFNDSQSLYAIITQLLTDVNYLQSGLSGKELSMYIQYNGELHQVFNGCSIELTTPDSYYQHVFGGKHDSDEIQEALGTVVEDTCNLIVLNANNEPLYLHTLVPGNGDEALPKTSYPDYANIPNIVNHRLIMNSVYQFDFTVPDKPVFGQAVYRNARNFAANRRMTIEEQPGYCYMESGVAKNINKKMAQIDIDEAFADYTSSTNRQRIVSLVSGFSGSNRVIGLARKCNHDYPGIGIHIDMPMYYGAYTDDLTVLNLISSADYSKYNGIYGDENNPLATDVSLQGQYGQPWVFNAVKLALQFPVIQLTASQQENPQRSVPIAQAYVGRSLLTDRYLQPAIFKAGQETMAGQTVQYNAITHFIPEVHKYTSGMASRGSFLFLCPQATGNIVLPVYGSSNAIQITRCTENAPGYIIPIKFQTRMCDRLGVTDVSHKVLDYTHDGQLDDRASVGLDVNAINTGHLRPSNNGNNFTYSKTITLSIRSGFSTITFDLTFRRPWR